MIITTLAIAFLNDVIEQRTGIPITLAIVYLEVARRINFPMVGVGMPGHFMIRPAIGEMEIFVDAFNSGEVMFLDDCQQRLSQIYHQSITLQPEFFQAVNNRQVLARVLTNLKFIYLNRQDLVKALAAVERILLLFPDIVEQIRDRGLIHYHLGHLVSAREDLAYYLAQVPNANDAPEIRRLLHQLGRN